MIPDRTMVEHDVWDLLAEEAPAEPVKVQLAALFASEGAGVISGAATTTGDATAAPAAKATNKVEVKETMIEILYVGQ